MGCKDEYKNTGNGINPHAGTPDEPCIEICPKCKAPILGDVCSMCDGKVDISPENVDTIYGDLTNKFMNALGDDIDADVVKPVVAVASEPPVVVAVPKKATKKAKAVGTSVKLEQPQSVMEPTPSNDVANPAPAVTQADAPVKDEKLSDLMTKYPAEWPTSVTSVLKGLALDPVTTSAILGSKDRPWMYLPRCPYCKRWVSPKTGVCNYKKCSKFGAQVVSPSNWEWPPKAPSVTKLIYGAKSQSLLTVDAWKDRVAKFNPKIVWTSNPAQNYAMYQKLCDEVADLVAVSQATFGEGNWDKSWYSDVLNKVSDALVTMDAQTAQILAYQKGFMFPSLIGSTANGKASLVMWLNPAYHPQNAKVQKIQDKAIWRFENLQKSTPPDAEKALADEEALAAAANAGGLPVPFVVDKYNSYQMSDKFGKTKFLKDLDLLYVSKKGYFTDATLPPAQYAELMASAQKYFVSQIDLNADDISDEEKCVIQKLSIFIANNEPEYKLDFANNGTLPFFIKFGYIPMEKIAAWKKAQSNLMAFQTSLQDDDFAKVETWNALLDNFSGIRNMYATDTAALPKFVGKQVTSSIVKPPYQASYFIAGQPKLKAARKALVAHGMPAAVNHASGNAIMAYINGEMQQKDLILDGQENHAVALVKKNKTEQTVAVFSDANATTFIMQNGDSCYSVAYPHESTKANNGKITVAPNEAVLSETLKMLAVDVNTYNTMSASGAIKKKNQAVVHCPNCGRFKSYDAECKHCQFKGNVVVYATATPKPVEKAAPAPAPTAAKPVEPPQPKVTYTPPQPAAATPPPTPSVAVPPTPKQAASIPTIGVSANASASTFAAQMQQVQAMLQAKKNAQQQVNSELPLVNYSTLTLTFAGKANLNGMHEKFFMQDPQGRKHLWKPDKHKGGAKARAEELAAQTFARIGLLAPTVGLTKHNGLWGSVQPMVPDCERLESNPTQWTSDQIAQVARSAIGNWLVSDHDGNGDNYLVNGKKTTFRIDMGQAYRYFPNDQLSSDYHPNESYGAPAPVTNAMWKMIANGTLNAPEEMVAPKMLDVIREAEKISDDNYRQLLNPLAQSVVGGGSNTDIGWYEPVADRARTRLGKSNVSDQEIAEEFILLNLERKHNLRSDFEKLMKKVYGKGFSFSKYEPVTA